LEGNGNADRAGNPRSGRVDAEYTLCIAQFYPQGLSARAGQAVPEHLRGVDRNETACLRIRSFERGVLRTQTQNADVLSGLRGRSDEGTHRRHG
jgi:hypothetical protein